MKLHTAGEDYLEAVLILQKKLGMVRSVDVARYMEVSKPSVCYAVGTLREGGFLTTDENHYIHLTDLGWDVAEKIYDGKIEMHHQTLDIDEAFSSQLPSNFQADIVIAVGVLNNSVNTDKCIYEINSVMKPGGILLVIETVEDVPDILITQSFMMTAPKDRRKATNTMFLNRKQWLEILEENGFCNSEEFPGYGEYLEVLGQKLFYCTKE